MFFINHDMKAKYQCVPIGTALTIAMFADGNLWLFLVQTYFFIRNGKPYIIFIPFVCIVFFCVTYWQKLAFNQVSKYF
jgi:hypothetical protein